MLLGRCKQGYRVVKVISKMKKTGTFRILRRVCSPQTHVPGEGRSLHDYKMCLCLKVQVYGFGP